MLWGQDTHPKEKKKVNAVYRGWLYLKASAIQAWLCLREDICD